MDHYAVIGNPIAHSKSPLIHALFAQQCQQQLDYKTLLSHKDSFELDVKNFFKIGKGLNVTVPFKIQALNFSDQLSDRAKQAGAVNTLIQQTDGSILGDNTDGAGLINDLLNNLDVSLTAKQVVIIGAGGATQGVLFPLLSLKPKQIIIVNRTLEKAEALSKKFSSYGKLDALSLDVLPDLNNIDVLINASSAGLTGESAILPASLDTTFCYDMIYSKELTPFLSAAKQAGCKNFSDGLGMLVEQAAESFFLWRGVQPETRPVLEQLRKQMI